MSLPGAAIFLDSDRNEAGAVNEAYLEMHASVISAGTGRGSGSAQFDAVVYNNGKILLHNRVCTHGMHTWCAHMCTPMHAQVCTYRGHTIEGMYI